MTRVPFGSTPSPFLLSATLQYHFRHVDSKYRDTAARLQRSSYADDLVFGASNSHEAMKLYKETNEIMDKAGMKMQKWTTNCHLLREKFRQDDGTSATARTSTTKVVGLNWNAIDDTISINLESVEEVLNGTTTKRSALQATSHIFDSLGLLAPFTIRAKILFQKIWIQGLDWEQTLPCEISDDWKKWCAELQDIKAFCVPRQQLAEISLGDHLTLMCSPT